MFLQNLDVNKTLQRFDTVALIDIKPDGFVCFNFKWNDSLGQPQEQTAFTGAQVFSLSIATDINNIFVY